MSLENGVGAPDVSTALLDSLQSDLRNLSIESKKKYPQLKEACDEAILKLKGAAISNGGITPIYYTINQVIYPLSNGCETKDIKIIRCCLQIIQKLITHQLLDQKGAIYVTDTLWELMESGIEEVKVLQSVTLLLTTNTVVHGETLARILVLCFRLHFAKNSTTMNPAGATVRQLVSLVFERVVTEGESLQGTEKRVVNVDELKVLAGTPPKGLAPCAADAFLLFQDLVQLVNADRPYWLIGMTEMTRTFGLELLESVLTQFSSVFYKNEEFSFLLKERVCALVIKLFSPNIKYRNMLPNNIHQGGTPFEKPYFPISMRLLRVVSVLIQKYHPLLVTESEIFLSLVVKFLDPDKPTWQRSLALEVLHRLTIQPELLCSFCQYYDLNKNTTSIFQDIVNSLGAYVQSLFVNNPLQINSNFNVSPGQPAVFLSSVPSTGPGTTPQPGFLLRGVWLPLLASFPTGQAKAIYLDILEKIEPPVIPDGYGVSVAYASLLEIVRSLQMIITPDRLEPPDETEIKDAEQIAKDLDLHTQLINSSWCGLLAAMTTLVDASTDESITECILKAIQTYASLCGKLNVELAKEAFVTAICRSSLPPHYALSVLSNVAFSGVGLRSSGRRDSFELNTQLLTQYGEMDYRQQVVAVGTPLPTTAVPAGTPQGPVMLTSKNLQAMRALLSLACCHGSILGNSWHLVLTTLQHLVWILGLKPSTGGSLKAARFGTTVASSATASNAAAAAMSIAHDSNAVITTSVMADLPVMSTMLSRLFESSQQLDDVALHHLINALCKLSQEAMELAYSNREPSLFAVAKLLESGLVNMGRIEVLWRPLTNHLLEVCHHPHLRMREWGVEAVTYLVKAAFHYKHSVPLRDNQKLQALLLGPLCELSSVPHGDVRQRQLECVLQMLHSAGETLSHGWPLVLNIIGAVNDQHGENLIRIAFQCLQLVLTDFLPMMPWRCLPQCVDTVTKFGSQTQELNISLTAIGLMWNISDYFHQNQSKLSEMSENSSECPILPEFPGTVQLSAFDKLWMCLYARLGELCVDSRPAVRKSAGQTLFSTIAAHGGLIATETWQALIWQVLFTLLAKVRQLSKIASDEKVDAGGSILIHHSRNTAQKQWAETQVLTLSGVARVFSCKRQLLQSLGADLPRAWTILLECIETAALSRNNEVSIAALKSFQEILFVSKQQNLTSHKSASNPDTDISSCQSIWANTWHIWLKIGLESTSNVQQFRLKSVDDDVKTLNDAVNTDTNKAGTTTPITESFVPCQTFLTGLMQIFPHVYQHVRQSFSIQDLQRLGTVMVNAVHIPAYGGDTQTSTQYIMSASSSDGQLTQLHEAILYGLELVQKDCLSKRCYDMVPILLRQLMRFSQMATLGVQQQRFPDQQSQHHHHHNLHHTHPSQHHKNPISKNNDFYPVNYVPFGQRAMTMMVHLYENTASVQQMIDEHILESIIRTLHRPLAMKSNMSQVPNSVWKLAADSLISVLKCGLPVARNHPEKFESMWTELSSTLNDFLFPTNQKFADKGLEELVSDESTDCLIIDVLRTDVLPYSNCIPKEFIMQVVILLNKGSIHSATSVKCDDSELALREEFAKTCFETLLQFSLIDENDQSTPLYSSGTAMGITGQLAVTSLLQRFQEVLQKYINDEKLSGKCPLPRYRLSEISFVLKAVTTLVISMKKAPTMKEDNKAWDYLINLYPYLVECTTTTSTQVSRPLREALLQFCDLLQPPNRKKNSIPKT